MQINLDKSNENKDNSKRIQLSLNLKNTPYFDYNLNNSFRNLLLEDNIDKI